MDITTLGEFRKHFADFPDDFKIEFRVRRKLSDEELRQRRYPYPYITEYFDGIDFDDVGYSDKKICLGVTLTWKPSGEQMKALNEIINTLATSKHPHESDYLFNILNGLRNEL